MILQGNSYRISLRDESIHCCVTSFPYHGLRSYNLPPTIWGGDSRCQHIWQTQVEKRGNGGERDYGSYDGAVGRGPAVKLPESAFCQLCGCWLGCFGLEPSISLHVTNAVAVCREIKRVLRRDGIFYLNYGDSYATGKNGRSAADTKLAGRDDRTFRDKPMSVTELPAKNLCMIPARVAIALQDDGWILRSEMGWYKGNAMPSSVQDRPGTAHEHVFMLVKSARYYFDMHAIRKPAQDRPFAGKEAKTIHPNDTPWHDNRYAPGATGYGHHPAGRAFRTSDLFLDSLDAYIAHLQDIRDNGGMLVDEDGTPAALVVNTESFSGAHYATFPRKLIAPLIKTSPEKVCPACSAPWVRVTQPTPEYAKYLGKDWADYEKDEAEGRGHFILPNGKKSGQRPTKRSNGDSGLTAQYVTTGWQPTCKCGESESETVGGIIFDPFCGSGTVGEVSRELGRRFIGIDLSAEYLQKNALPRAEKLTSFGTLKTLPMFADLDDEVAQRGQAA